MFGWDIKDLVMIMLNMVLIISNIRNIIIMNNEWVCLLIIFFVSVFMDLFLCWLLVYKVFMLCILVKNMVLKII